VSPLGFRRAPPRARRGAKSVDAFADAYDALSGVLKVSGNPKILETMTALGVGRHVRMLGVMELSFAALFVVPATMKLGFLLASANCDTQCKQNERQASNLSGSSRSGLPPLGLFYGGRWFEKHAVARHRRVGALTAVEAAGRTPS
jgi:hypothetical protein